MEKESTLESNHARITGESGYTLVLVLVAGAMLSLLSLLLIHQARWNTQMKDSRLRFHQLREAISLGEHRVERKVLKAMEDTGSIQHPTTMKRELPPGITLRTEVRSLNAKLNLNVLNDPARAGVYRKIVTRVLTGLGYPPRASDELIAWMEPGSELGTEAPSRYGGYSYQAPERDLKQLDELALVSGFSQLGIRPEVRSLFTVHGSGKLNVRHVSPAAWELLQGAFPERLPPAPASATRDQSWLREFLTKSEEWEQLQSMFPFLTRTDDTFAVYFRAKRNDAALRMKGVYRYTSEGNLKTITFHTLHRYSSSAGALSDVGG